MFYPHIFVLTISLFSFVLKYALSQQFMFVCYVVIFFYSSYFFGKYSVQHDNYPKFIDFICSICIPLAVVLGNVDLAIEHHKYFNFIILAFFGSIFFVGQAVGKK